jgi:protein arginine kinase activator
MKCQRCDKPATFHITELTGGQPQELHLCEEHAREYLTQSEGETSGTASLAGALAQQLAVGQTAEELARLDQKACPVCGITFYEFRNQGRLGCPHDYVCFQKELEPLILNIHGESVHVGKRPERSPTGTDRQTDLIRLRKDMKAAVNEEQYERASQLRDEIRRIEGEQKG